MLKRLFSRNGGKPQGASPAKLSRATAYVRYRNAIAQASNTLSADLRAKMNATAANTKFQKAVAKAQATLEEELAAAATGETLTPETTAADAGAMAVEETAAEVVDVADEAAALAAETEAAAATDPNAAEVFDAQQAVSDLIARLDALDARLAALEPVADPAAAPVDATAVAAAARRTVELVNQRVTRELAQMGAAPRGLPASERTNRNAAIPANRKDLEGRLALCATQEERIKLLRSFKKVHGAN